MANPRFSKAAAARAEKRAQRAVLQEKIDALRLKELTAKTNSQKMKYAAQRKTLEVQHYALRTRRKRK